MIKEISVSGLDENGALKDKRLSIKLLKKGKYMIFSAFSEIFPHQHLKVYRDGDRAEKIHLVYKKGSYAIPAECKKIEFEAEAGHSIQFSDFSLSDSTDTQKIRVTKNKILNIHEFIEGETDLKSYPMYLGIDIHGKCNINPACAYCDYDDIKKKEGKYADDVFSAETLETMGPFFTESERLINCSIGEPFLSPNIKDVLEKIDKEGKYLEIATNATLLTKVVRRHILGKRVVLVITINASKDETFRNLRDGQFKKVTENVRRLSEERTGKWPQIQMVFIPMKANLDDFKEHLEFCGEVADKLVIRPMNRGYDMKSKRNGYNFIYADEYPDENDWKRINNEIREFREKSSLIIMNLNEDEPEGPKTLRDAKMPLCYEPWTNYYILRRGILPCCHGHKTLGDFNDFRELWNGKEIRALRKSLSEGKFSNYCLNSLSCPKVQRYIEREKCRSTLYRLIPQPVKKRLYDIVPLVVRRKIYRAMCRRSKKYSSEIPVYETPVEIEP